MNHLWQIDHKSSLSTALYASIGRGNGYSGTGTSAYRSKWYGASNGYTNDEFRLADGTFNYDAVDALNQASTTGFADGDGQGHEQPRMVRFAFYLYN